MRIDPRRTFRMIIGGSSNRRAIELVRQATRTRAPNPLLIRGASGVGKTLLLHAAANELVRRRGPLAIAAFTTEEFRSAYLHAIREAGVRQFQHSIDRCDVLVVDALEDFTGFPSAFAELECAIRRFIGHDKPVLLATGPAWNEALEWLVRESPFGAAAVLEPPTQKQRLVALQRLCGTRRKRLSRAVMRAIARRTRTIGEARAQVERALIEQRVASASAGRRPSSRA